MLTLNIDYEVLPDRLLTIKLPETVSVGRHEMVIVLEENEAAETNVVKANEKKLMQFAEAVSAFNGVDGVEYQKNLRKEWS